MRGSRVHVLPERERVRVRVSGERLTGARVRVLMMTGRVRVARARVPAGSGVWNCDGRFECVCRQ